MNVNTDTVCADFGAKVARGIFNPVGRRIGPIGGLFKRRWSMGIGRARLGS